MKVVKLNFQAPVHFGNKRLSDSNFSFSSDTLFSALMIEAVKLNEEDHLYNLVKSGKIIFSDAFPFIDEFYYIPRPNIRIKSKDETKRKSFKKLHYIPLDYDSLSNYFSGELDPDFERSSFRLGEASLSERVQQHDYDDSEPYNVGIFNFNSNAGLYFLTNREDDFIDELLNSLQYSGIGGKRSSGYGRFTYEILDDDELSKIFETNGDCKILLSNALPKEVELEKALDGASYILQRRSGFIQSDTYSKNLVKKRDLYTFTSGSTFKNYFEGDVYQVGKNGSHPVYKYAKAFFLEIQL